MREETPQEAAFHNLLPDPFANMAKVDMDYQGYLRIANQHLITLYGARVDTTKRMEQYRESRVGQAGCRIVSQCDNMPILSRDDLLLMIREDEQYQANVNRFLQLCTEGEAHSEGRPSSDEQKTMELAQILGVLPDCGQDALYRWLIDRRNLTYADKRELNAKIAQNLNLISVIVNSLSKTFVPGMLQTFPIVGTVMTQQKGRYYYRGESAFYGSSKPGIFRGHDPKIPEDMEQMIRHMKMDEACCFLDNFEAVKKWNYSAVNYVALAQHYGIGTYMMDITSDLKTALFFACCKYDYNAKNWRPLKYSEFAEIDSRMHIAKLGGDSRYGVLYRSPTELMDYKWLTDRHDALFGNIIPVGYQPFMRCSSQHGYMLMVKEPKYDMMKAGWFHKFRFRLDEDLCQWIFDTMEQGNKIYPHNDVPEMEQYMERIKTCKAISRTNFDHFIKKYDLTEQENERCAQSLTKYGYTVVRGDNSYITPNHLAKINRKYGVEEALKRTEGLPVMSPIIHLLSDTPVRKNENGDYDVSEKPGSGNS